MVQLASIPTLTSANRTFAKPRCLFATLACSTLFLAACSTPQIDRRIVEAAEVGQFGYAAERLQQDLTNDPADRDYLLSRFRLLTMAMADGQPDAAEETANQLFALLRTQGLNEDKGVASVVFYEGVRRWKGEPFEQALAYSYISMQKAMRGEWDNARASAMASQFVLRDFSAAFGGKEPTSIQLAERAAKEDAKSSGKGDEFLDKGYVVSQSDFTLGYLLSAIANHAINREDEASDNLNAAVRANSNAEQLAARLRQPYNTVLIVGFGRGPAKVATGPDGAVAEFALRSPSDDRPLQVQVSNNTLQDQASTIPIQDLNRMAQSHRWRNLEDIRTLKSNLGSLLLAGGVVVAASADDIGRRRDSNGNRTVDKSNRDAALVVGATMAAIGALMKATAVADTRHMEFLPQRFYVVPLQLEQGVSDIRLQVAGSSSPLLLTGLTPPTPNERVQMRYVHMPANSGALAGAVAEASQSSSASAKSQLRYSNNAWPFDVEGDTLPFIFGGRDASVPTPAIMDRYHNAGNLSNLTQVDLENLYRAEGIALSVEDAQGNYRKHILEGGNTLVAPMTGTTGYTRVFMLPKPPYKPRSDELKQAIDAEQRKQ
ncbi:MAG: hypothetical protein U0640_02940 [Phycisphaerales bacterium]